MAKKLSRSNKHLAFDYIDNLYKERTSAIESFFVPTNGYFVGCTEKDIQNRLHEHLQEAEHEACMTLLAAIEAALRIDCDYCCFQRPKTARAKKIREIVREIAKDTEGRRSVEIKTLIEHLGESQRVKDKLKTFFLYRHWLAHGRYWTLKTNIPGFIFVEIYRIAIKIQGSLYQYK